MNTTDTVVTLAIGRIDANGTPLPEDQWELAQRFLIDDADAYGDVVATANGRGVTSDQAHQMGEETFIIILVNPTDLDMLRCYVGNTLDCIGLSSACFSVDGAHEPAWPTHDGKREVLTPPQVTAKAYAPAHGGYPSA